MEREKLHVYSTILFVETTKTQNLMYLRETETLYFVTQTEIIECLTLQSV